MTKGIVFTIEALVALAFFLIAISSIAFVTDQRRENLPLYETVIMNDIFQVLELKYHTEVATFMRTGTVSQELDSYLKFVKEKTGHTVFLKFMRHSYPYSGCDPYFSQKRLIVYYDIKESEVSYFHELTVGLCR
ncbi:MAG: hypothetical protein N3G74_02095 [Candidatus Micrarchaeota archaeon]|nr:hypothetical protein [Candidatus Micrarchaeota archaeon]